MKPNNENKSMKATEAFAKTIGAYIEKEKQADPLFAKCVDDQPKKTIQGCVNYILNEVKKSGIAGWTDAEIFGMAKHFYDEKELKDPGAVRARVVVNHHVELSEDEKAEAKKKALKEYQEVERKKLEAKAKAERTRVIKREEAKAKALMEKRERESKMQLDLFGM